ncbi:MAG: response regulator [Desulfobacterales bacterium]|jgi:two-component system chemotaxis response regulator CheY
MKILIAEDDFVSRKLVNTLLSPLGEVDIAVNGNEAVMAVKMALKNNQPYDFICLDILMPEVDGIMALKKIRQLEAQKGLNPETRSKIIMTTAVSDKNYVVAAAQANCDGFLVKPITKDRLFDEIRKHGLDITE